MTPITKNGMITVVDRNGVKKGVTYYKRAKGLVKNGRARYTDDGCICVLQACPPEKTEDSEMSEYINQVRDNNGNVVTETACEAMGEVVTVADILKRIDAVIASGEQFAGAVEALRQISATDMQHGSSNAGNKAIAIKGAIQAREETNQRLLDFLKRVYEDVRKPKPSSIDADMRKMVLDTLVKGMELASEDHTIRHISERIQELFQN